MSLCAAVCCNAGEIHDAVRKQDLQAVQKLLKQDPELVHSIDYPDFLTPLYLAVSVGDPALVKCLLETGASVDVRSPDPLRMTPLARAAILAEDFENRMSKAQKFLSGTPGIVALDAWDKSLMLVRRSASMPEAERNCRLEVLRILLETKPDTNKDFILGYAAAESGPAVVKLLLDSGADANVKGPAPTWMTPLHTAVTSKESAATIDLLVAAGADIEASDRKGRTALMLAARYDSPAAVKSLIKHGASVDAEDLERLPGIGYAAMSGNDEIVRLIHQAGGPDLIRYAKKDLLMQRAARFGSMELTRILLEEGVPIDQRDKEGFSPLLTAVEADHRDLADFLIAEGADLKVRTQHGTGLFTIACGAGNIELAEKLLAEGGWDAELKRPSLLQEMVQCGNVRGVEFVLKHGADVNYRPPQKRGTPLSAAIVGPDFRKDIAPGPRTSPTEDDFSRIVELLLAHGARADQSEPDGQSVVSLAARHCGARVMKALLQAGGKSLLNKKSTYNETPLQIAISHGRAETVKVMLEAGADCNVLLDAGQNLIQHAAASGNAPALKLLIDEGMAPDAINPKEETSPLVYAALTNSPECVELLLKAGLTPNPKQDDDRILRARHRAQLTPNPEQFVVPILPPLLVAVEINYSLRWLQGGRFHPRILMQAQNLQDRLKVIHMLLVAGARTDMVLQGNKSVIDLARSNGTPEIVQVLETHQRALRKTGKP